MSGTSCAWLSMEVGFGLHEGFYILLEWLCPAHLEMRVRLTPLLAAVLGSIDSDK